MMKELSLGFVVCEMEVYMGSGEAQVQQVMGSEVGLDVFVSLLVVRGHLLAMECRPQARESLLVLPRVAP